MKWSERHHLTRLLVVAIAAIIASAIAWYQFSKPTGQQTEVIPGSSASTSVDASPAVVAPAPLQPSSGGLAPDPDTVPNLAPSTTLDQQVKRFAEAYYLITPTDTTSSRRKRVQALGSVSAQALTMLDFSLQPSEVEYQRLGITQLVVADVRTLTANPVAGDNQQQVSMPLALVWSDDSGNQIGGSSITTVSQWSFDGTAWSMTDFSPDGGE